ncbi:hypothetical protein BC828DRAFT_401285 [Blastocladiella britannica]|nr:hypothetical protein BC828DRAFT_401285 [Blastocladiella britannica]
MAEPCCWLQLLCQMLTTAQLDEFLDTDAKSLSKVPLWQYYGVGDQALDQFERQLCHIVINAMLDLLLASAVLALMRLAKKHVFKFEHAGIAVKMVVAYDTFYLYISSQVPTAKMLDQSDKALRTFFTKYNELCNMLNLEQEHKLKFHMLAHYCMLDEQFGVLVNQSTQHSKQEHLVSVKPGAKCTNYKTGTLAGDILEVQQIRNAVHDHLHNVYARIDAVFQDKTEQYDIIKLLCKFT